MLVDLEKSIKNLFILILISTVLLQKEVLVIIELTKYAVGVAYIEFPPTDSLYGYRNLTYLNLIITSKLIKSRTNCLIHLSDVSHNCHIILFSI